MAASNSLAAASSSNANCVVTSCATRIDSVMAKSKDWAPAMLDPNERDRISHLNPLVNGLSVVSPQIGNQDVWLNWHPFSPIFNGFGHEYGRGQTHENPRMGQPSQVWIPHRPICRAHAGLSENWTSFLVLKCTRKGHACRCGFPIDDQSDRSSEATGFGMLLRKKQRVRFPDRHRGHGVNVSRFCRRFEVLVHPSFPKPLVMTAIDLGGEFALFRNKGIGKVCGGIGKVVPKQFHAVGLSAGIASEVDHQWSSMLSNVFKSQTEPTLEISPGPARKRGNVQCGHACQWGTLL